MKSRLGSSLATVGWLAAAIVGLTGLALVPALALLVYLHQLGLAVASALLFAEAAVDLAATLVPLSRVLRAQSLRAVVLTELVVAIAAALCVRAVLSRVLGAEAAAIPAWWLSLLAARRACTAASARLALHRKQLAAGVVILFITGAAVPVLAALLTSSITDVLVVSMIAQALVFVFILPSALRGDADATDEPLGWGKWLAEVATGVPIPLAVLWSGKIALAAPLSAVSFASLLCWMPFFAVLSRDKLDRSVRMIFAPALAIAFGLVEQTIAPGICAWLFPSLTLDPAWFAAIGWAGALLLAVPLPPSWQLSDNQTSRGVTALLGLAAIVAGVLLAGLPGLALGAAVMRALQWRPERAA